MRYTVWLGKFACRVCSKILGIGSAERAWGDVKHLKTDKRSHLSADRVKKQATIFGISCIAKAEAKIRYKDKEKNNNNTYDNKDIISTSEFLDVLDYKDDYDLLSDIGNKKEKVKRLFNNWCENWELEAINNKNIVNERKLLGKYGGLSWQDSDHNDTMCTAKKDTMKWFKGKRGESSGYCVIALGEGYESDDSQNSLHIEPWEISEDLRDSIATYYKTHPNLGVLVVNETTINTVSVQSLSSNVCNKEKSNKNDVDTDSIKDDSVYL